MGGTAVRGATGQEDFLKGSRKEIRVRRGRMALVSGAAAEQETWAVGRRQKSILFAEWSVGRAFFSLWVRGWSSENVE